MVVGPAAATHHKLQVCLEIGRGDDEGARRAAAEEGGSKGGELGRVEVLDRFDQGDHVGPRREFKFGERAVQQADLEGTGKVQGRYREFKFGERAVQGRYREGTGKVQGRYREGTGSSSSAREPCSRRTCGRR